MLAGPEWTWGAERWGLKKNQRSIHLVINFMMKLDSGQHWGEHREAEKTRETKVPAVTSLLLGGRQEDKMEIEEC